MLAFFFFNKFTAVCTLDVSDIKFVVNYDFPNNTEDYVHRIGRTARAKNTGTAYSFFTSGNSKQAKELIDLLREAKQEVSPKLIEMMQLARHFGANGRGMCGTHYFKRWWALFRVWVAEAYTKALFTREF